MSDPLVLSLFPGIGLVEPSLPPFTASAKVEAVGNGVPLPMGRAIAKAVKAAMYSELETLTA